MISVTLLNNRTIYPFPNCYTLLPTCGATLIILFGEKDTFVGALLSKRPLRWTGLISYSAYLWHQPLLAFTRLRYGETSSLSCIAIVIIVGLPLSVCSYLFIEQPFRQTQRISQKKIFISAAVGTFLTFVLALFLIRTGNNRSLLSEPGSDSYLADLKQYGNVDYTVGAYNMHQGVKTFSNDTASTKRRMALIGDSFSQDFLNIVIEGKHLTNYEICPYYVHNECQIYIGTEDKQQFILPQFREFCRNGNDIKYALPMIRQANLIVLAAGWKEWNAERLPTTITLLNLTKEQQLIIIGIKNFGPLQPMFYANKSKEYRLAQYGYPEDSYVQMNTFLEGIIDPSMYVNVMNLVCTGYNNTCPLFTRDGKLISYDSWHLTKYGALYVGQIIFSRKPLNQL